MRNVSPRGENDFERKPPLKPYCKERHIKFTGLIAAALALLSTAAYADDAKSDADAGVSLAGTFVNFMKFCPNDFAALTPQYQDAVMVFVEREASKHGAAAVKQSAIKKYEDGYYKFGDRWCPSASSTAKGIARIMTR
jgi:hypothetical protein